MTEFKKIRLPRILIGAPAGTAGAAGAARGAG